MSPAATVFVAVNALIVRRQSAPHTWLLLGLPSLWLANGSFAWTGMSEAVLAAWFAFLVLTIAGGTTGDVAPHEASSCCPPLAAVVLLALSLGPGRLVDGASWAGAFWYQPG